MNLKGENEMKNRAIGTLLVATLASTMVVIPSLATEVKEVKEPIELVESVEIMPRDMPVADGTIYDKSGLDIDKKLNKANGKYVNFYIENIGPNPVTATINGQEERTFQVGEKGHIYVEVTQGIFGDKNYNFKAVPAKNGGTVHINYIIYQRDTQS